MEGYGYGRLMGIGMGYGWGLDMDRDVLDMERSGIWVGDGIWVDGDGWGGMGYAGYGWYMG